MAKFAKSGHTGRGGERTLMSSRSNGHDQRNFFSSRKIWIKFKFRLWSSGVQTSFLLDQGTSLTKKFPAFWLAVASFSSTSTESRNFTFSILKSFLWAIPGLIFLNFIFVNVVDSKRSIYFFCQWLNSNRGPLESEATALGTYCTTANALKSSKVYHGH